METQIAVTLKCSETHCPPEYDKIIHTYVTEIIHNCSMKNYPMDRYILINRCRNIVNKQCQSELTPEQISHLLRKSGQVFLQKNEELFLIKQFQIDPLSPEPFHYAITFYSTYLHTMKNHFHNLIISMNCEEDVDQTIVAYFWEQLKRFNPNYGVRFCSMLYHEMKHKIYDTINKESFIQLDPRMRRKTRAILKDIEEGCFHPECAVDEIVKQYSIKRDFASLLWNTEDMFAHPKEYYSVNETDLCQTTTSNIYSDIELLLSLDSMLNETEKEIILHIIAGENKICKEFYDELNISRYYYSKVKNNAFNKIRHTIF